MVTLIVLWPLTEAEFINYDDPLNIINNQHIQIESLDQVFDIWRITVDNHYTPLVYSSYAIDYHFFGLSPKAFHFTNILLHCVNLLLLFWLSGFLFTNHLLKTLLVLLFSIHPVNLEAVAWISARNYLMAGMFALISTLSLIYYFKSKVKWAYLFSIITFTLSLLSGRMYIMLPVVFTMVLFFKSQLTSNWKSLIPHYSISLFMGIISLYLVTNISNVNSTDVTFSDGIFQGFYGLSFSLYQFIVPLKSTLYHTFLDFKQHWIAFILFLFIFIKNFRNKNTWIGFGLYFILIFITLKFSFLDYYGAYITADRYNYLPYVGLLTVIGVFFKALNSRFYSYLLILPILTFGYITWKATSNWKNSLTVWNRVLEIYPNTAYAHNNIGNYHIEKSENEKARESFLVAMSLDPLYVQPIVNYGNYHLISHRNDSAIVYYNRALELDPENLRVLQNKGIAYYKTKNYRKSFTCFLKIYERNSEFPGVKNQLRKSVIQLQEIGSNYDSLELSSLLKTLQ